MDSKGKIQHFTDLHVWQEAHTFVIEIYKETKQFPRDERFGMTNQMRRSVVSITSNLAEGFARQHKIEKIQFYSIAHGSNAEIQSQLLTARDIDYIDSKSFRMLYDQSVKVGKMINALITSIRVSKK